MAEALARRLRRSAFCYGILALAAVGAFLIAFDALDRNVGALVEASKGPWRSVVLEWSLMFALNGLLALCAWNFLRLPQAGRVAIFAIAVVAPALAAIGLVLDAWHYGQGSAFIDANRSMLVSGFGGRLLIVVGYVLIAIPLYKALREPHQPG